MKEKQLYISRPPEGEELYTTLQQHTLEELQRLAGEVWTDFNAHDPGVTLADAANYALTETDYKLDFDLEDYLTAPEGTFQADEFGLFAPANLYPTAPITIDDYRKLLLAHFPMLENVAISMADDGTYRFALRVSSFFEHTEGLTEQVRQFYHEHRNLCETVGEITIQHPRKLSLSVDIEVYSDRDATDILVDIYWKAMQYISGSINIKPTASQTLSAIPPEEWWDGPVNDVRVTIPVQQDTENELYHQLCQIQGIKDFTICYFVEQVDGEEGKRVRTDFKDGYTLQVPERLDNIIIRVDGEPVEANPVTLREKLKARHFTKGTSRMRFFLQTHNKEVPSDNGQEERASAGLLCKGTYHDIYAHYPVYQELPKCYRTGSNFQTYTELYDYVMKRALEEAKGLRPLLSIREEGRMLNEQVRPDIFRIKNVYLDFLDSLYGVASDARSIEAIGRYGEHREDQLRQRMDFLREMPELVRDRSQAANLLAPCSRHNIPTLKRCLSLLLGMNSDETTSVGNILPSHNLMLLGDGKERRIMRDWLDAMLVDEKRLNAENIRPISPVPPPQDRQEKLERYEEVRRYLPVFNSNWISGGLFREGIHLENYQLVEARNGEHLLIFRNREENKLMNLGRSNDPSKLCRWANTLCRYLLELNRECEAVYLIEKRFLTADANPFTVLLICTGWTARTRMTRFRETCEQLTRSLLPAHLTLEMHWVGERSMQYFEEHYQRWRLAMNGSYTKETKEELQSSLLKLIDSGFVPPSETKETDRKEGGAP
ncbi:MAG: hypothetical protein LBN24_10495 [Mediterranea sp.]|jgi:hypothetical protein|nr:hypothetical protein [Mediterranea sp.]